MAKEITKEIEWKEVLEKSAELSGAPKKQLEADADAIDKGIRTILTEKQPKRDNDAVIVKTPFGAYCSTRLPETVIQTDKGKQTRPSCCAVNIGIPRAYIDAANIGLVDKETDEKKSKNA